MNLNASINVRVARKVKTNAEQVLSELGLTMSEAVNIYLRQIALRGGIPFDLRLPNRKTVRAMRDVQQKRNLESFTDIDSMQQGLNS
ncbi:type II toxin-antitoxin system RelB/DinJ family antitoxin [bacterium]|nr:type II toxin-antitoxin system RelB/DinJ family antitoxin [bacterium]MBU1632985.1 type II toxin-antitoxin system RelB/DinJ family antitoxin [bacterium]